MISFKRDYVSLAFTHVHKKARADIALIRTLRVPDDGNDYPLPPGLGRFPVVASKAAHTADAARADRTGLVPMWPSEALWLDFTGNSYPCAVKIGVGGANALTGERLTADLSAEQDYVVVPGQPWLDGVLVSDGAVRQFVAEGDAKGRTIASQLGIDGSHPSIEMLFYPMRRPRYEWLLDDSARSTGMPRRRQVCAGGKIRQHIYRDQYGLDAWVREPAGRLQLDLIPAASWFDLTGKRSPTKPPNAHDYTKAGLPWFDYYDPAQRKLAATPKMKQLVGAAETDLPLSVPEKQVRKLHPTSLNAD